MSTGNFDSWNGTIAEMSQIYPFVGTEMLLTILCVIFWVGFHVLQTRIENRELAEEERRYADNSKLEELVKNQNNGG